MTSYAITYIPPGEGCPSFTVNFRDFVQHETRAVASNSNKVKEAVSPIFKFFKCFFTSLAEASYSSLSMLGTSFKFTVLGYYGNGYRPPESIMLLVFKIIVWVVEVAWCILSTTGRLLVEKMENTKRQGLSVYLSPEINVDHIRTKELSLDVSRVPADVQVDQLAAMLNEVNFEDHHAPGFMGQGARTEGRTVFTRQQLSRNLATFIHHVKNRTPFMGTPPGYDIPRLMAFYQQIEDSVRLSIHKVNEDLRLFRNANPGDPSSYQGIIQQTYHELLQARARVPLDLAIAGTHCGARYMGEATSVHSALYREGQVDGTLEDELIEVLARNRKEVAQQQIQQHLGNDTHAYASYMFYLGKLLAIPGTKNIVEHLRSLPNKQELIDCFFKAYTPDTMIETIQQHVRKSAAFREKIVNWLKNQATNWNQEKYNALHIHYAQHIQRILNAAEEIDAKQIDHINLFRTVATHVMATCSDPQAILTASGDDWEDFMREIFATPEAKQWMNNIYFNHLDPADPSTKIRKAQAIQAIQNACSKEVLGTHLSLFRDSIQKNISFDFGLLKDNLALHQKVHAMTAVFSGGDEGMQPPAEETLKRIISGAVSLEAVLKDHLERARSDEFLQKLAPPFKYDDNGQTQGMSKKMMEWLLVSHHILISQAQ